MSSSNNLQGGKGKDLHKMLLKNDNYTAQELAPHYQCFHSKLYCLLSVNNSYTWIFIGLQISLQVLSLSSQ